MTNARFTFLWFFFAQAANYALLCWNYRAVAQAKYLHIAASDALCACVTFFLIQHVAQTKPDNRVALAGYISGGICGSLLSVWVTERIFGQ